MPAHRSHGIGGLLAAALVALVGGGCRARSAPPPAPLPLDPTPSVRAQPGLTAQRVEGSVTHGGRAVPGAIVEITHVAGLGASHRAQADADGRFELADVPPAMVAVTATAPGLAARTIVADLRVPDRTPLALILADCRAVRGRIMSVDGTPLGSARVGPRFFDRDAFVVAVPSVPVGKDGTFEVCLPGGGMHFLQASAPGFGSTLTEVHVVAGGAIANVAIVLGPEAGIRGRLDLPASAPLGPTWVIASGLGDRNPARLFHATLADAEGHFEMRGLAPGVHRIWAEGARARTPFEFDVTTSGPGTAGDGLTLGLRETGTVQGHLLDGETPVAGARVCLRVNSRDRTCAADAVSQADGSFVLAGVPVGIESPLIVLDHELVGAVRVRVDPAAAPLAIQVRRPRTIAGTVTRGGKPVARARVVALAGADVVASAVGAASGAFTLAIPALFDVPLGSLRVEAQDLEDWQMGSATPAGGDGKVALEIKPGAVKLVSGAVVDTSGTPVAGVTVELMGPDPGSMTPSGGSTQLPVAPNGGITGAWTGPDGRFEFEMPAWLGQTRTTVWLRVTVGDRELELVGPTPAPARDLRLVARTKRARLAVKVTDAHGAAVADARVIAQASLGQYVMGGPPPATVLRKTPDGGYAADGLVAGQYDVRALTSDGGVAFASMDLGGEDASVTLALAPLGSASGQLSGFGPWPLVELHTQVPRPWAYRVPVVDGRFRATALPVGSYHVFAFDFGQVVAGSLEVTASADAHLELQAGGSGTVTGRVTDAGSGRGLADVHCDVTLLDADGDAAAPLKMDFGTETDDTGAYRLPVPSGKVQVTCVTLGVSREHLSPPPQSVDVGPGQTVTLDLVAP